MELLIFIFFATSAFGFAPPQLFVNNRKGIQHQSSDNDNDFDMGELTRRIQTVAASDKLQESFMEKSFVSLPVLAFDALLPRQRLEGTTTDPTFGRFLRDTGLGGLFVMISVNQSKRMLRRNGVLCRIDVVDAKAASIANNEDRLSMAPTAVDFSVVGLRHVRLVGPATGFKTRVGRWRRSYDPDGEESALGWGEERFVDALPNATSFDDNQGKNSEDTKSRKQTEWSLSEVDCSIVDADTNDPRVVQQAKDIAPLLQEWQSLASNIRTYDNVNVVATARLAKGHPGLRVDPAALLRNVLQELGEKPTNPTAMAFWGAALVNPMPALGVAPELRGQILEAGDAKRRLQILEWGIQRSIRNLQGTDPLV